MTGLRTPVLVAIGGVLLLVLVSSIVPAGSGAVDSTTNSELEPGAEGPLWYLDPPPEREKLQPVPGFTAGAIAPEQDAGVGNSHMRSRSRSASVDLRPMLFFFQRELELSSDQLRHFRRVLGKRDVAVGELQDEIQRTQSFAVEARRAQIEEIQAIHYENMGRCLGPLQHQRFLEILAEGRFGDAIVLELPARD